MLERPSSPETVTEAPPTGRRILFFTLVLLSMIGLIWLLTAALAAGGFTPGDFLLVVLFAVTLPWLVIGFWNATMGFLIIRFARDPVVSVTPAAARATGNEPILSSTAILVCIRNEPPERVIRHLVPMLGGLAASGVGHRFPVYILSDTADLAHAEMESRHFAELEDAMRENPCRSPIGAANPIPASRRATFATFATAGASCTTSELCSTRTA